MDEWTPILVLPNADMRFAFDCQHAAIVSPQDGRALKLQTDHPNLKSFLSRFRDQFGDEMWPALLLIRTDAPKSYYTAEAVTAFRDILSLSVVLYTRATHFSAASGLAYTNTFRFYPWMLDNYEDMILTNPAMVHAHLLVLFGGQTFPEQGCASITNVDVDRPLALALLARWIVRFSGGAVEWRDQVLFRSLNMANEAGRIPAETAAVFWDAGRLLALWVSALEILAHPGGNKESNFGTVSALLECVRWLDPKLKAATHTVKGKPKQLATWVCRKVYDRRNDFLHGNDVDASGLALNGRRMTDLAACLFRLALTGFLDLHFDTARPDSSDAQAVAAFAHEQMAFNKFQRVHEAELLEAV
jgi:hypothetical protein